MCVWRTCGRMEPTPVGIRCPDVRPTHRLNQRVQRNPCQARGSIADTCAWCTRMTLSRGRSPEWSCGAQTCARREPDGVVRRPPPMQNHLRRLIAMVALAAMVAACQSIPAVGSLVPLGSDPLVSVTVRGGECPEGACGSTTVIERGGRVHQPAPVAAEMGALTGDLFKALETAVKTTDFDVIRARPFTGECPVNFDGQETIF